MAKDLVIKLLQEDWGRWEPGFWGLGRVEEWSRDEAGGGKTEKKKDRQDANC